jgi:hypothetical protein
MAAGKPIRRGASLSVVNAMGKSKARAQAKPSRATTGATTSAEKPSDSDGRRRIWPLASLIVVTAVAFSPAFRADFVRWDDHIYVTENQLLRDLKGLGEIWNPRSEKLRQYYPLTFSSYWVEYQLWDLNSGPYHVVNVLLHVVNSLLVASLVGSLGGSPWVAAGAAALFALHPAQVESVAWVTERKNTLSGLFYLIAFLLYLKHRREGSWRLYAGSLLAFLAALLSKTQVLTLPIVLVVTDWLLQANSRLSHIGWRGLVARVAPMLVLAVLCGAITARVEDRVAPDWLSTPSLLERLFIAAGAAWFYVWTFLWPANLVPIYPRWSLSLGDARWWLALVAWPIAGVLLLRLGHRIPTLVIWGIAYFIISLIPVLGFIPFTYQKGFTYVADRFLYLPCIGGGVALSVMAERLSVRAKLPSVMAAVFVAALIFFAAATYAQSMHWRSNLRLWSHLLEKHPDSFRANLNLGEEYEARGNRASALTRYRRAYELRPVSDAAFTGLMRALDSLQGPEAVIRECNLRLQDQPWYADAVFFYRGTGYERLGRLIEAKSDYRRVLRISEQGSRWWREANGRLQRLEQAQGDE